MALALPPSPLGLSSHSKLVRRASSGNLSNFGALAPPAFDEDDLTFSIYDKESTWRFPPWLQSLSKFADKSRNTVPFQVAIAICTIYALFGNDIRLLAFPPSADLGFAIVATIVFSIFSIELILNSFYEPRFFGRLFFWLDLLAILSLIPEIPWFIGTEVGESDTSLQRLGLARASRAARAATRIARIIRVVRIVKWVQLLSTAQTMKHIRRFRRRVIRFIRPSYVFKEDETDEDPDSQRSLEVGQSKMGQAMTKLSTRKIILGIFLLLIVFSLVDTPDPNVSIEVGLRTIYSSYLERASNPTAWFEYARLFCDYQDTKLNHPIVYMKVGNESVCCLDDFLCTQGYPSVSFRNGSELQFWCLDASDLDVSLCQDDSTLAIVAHIDFTIDVTEQSTGNLLLTIYVILLLIFLSWSFQRDATSIVIGPVERMVRLLDSLASNPFITVKKKKAKKPNRVKTSKNEETEQMEKRAENATLVIEQVLVKVMRLLQLGLGEAGAEIMSKNLSSKGYFNPMTAGKRVRAMFGFCDIRSFTDMTELLEEDVVLLVNHVASIVHHYVHKSGGYPNKNVGDAFLVVWKFSSVSLDDHTKTLPGVPADAKALGSSKSRRSIVGKEFRSPTIAPISTVSTTNGKRNSISVKNTTKSSKNVNVAADSALTAVSDLIIAIAESKELAILSARPIIQNHFPGFTVKIGFGLHVGWAIEGAIGSIQKVDCSYISSDCNITERLEGICKTYNVPLVLSGDFVSLLSKGMQYRCRILDRVKWSDIPVPYTLYTYAPNISLPKNVRMSATELFAKQFTTTKSQTKKKVHITKQDPFTRTMTNEWVEKYELGVNHYIEGRWSEAIPILEKCQQTYPDDGPIAFLLERMAEDGNEAPAEWPGYRDLT